MNKSKRPDSQNEIGPNSSKPKQKYLSDWTAEYHWIKLISDGVNTKEHNDIDSFVVSFVLYLRVLLVYYYIEASWEAAGCCLASLLTKGYLGYLKSNFNSSCPTCWTLKTDVHLRFDNENEKLTLQFVEFSALVLCLLFVLPLLIIYSHFLVRSLSFSYLR